MIGKRVIAHEKIYQFSTGKLIKDKKRIIGIIENIDDDTIYIYDADNPVNYRHYTIDKAKFNQWIDEGLYTIGRKTYPIS